MRVFKTRHFSKWAKKNLLTDKLVFRAASEISNGHFEVNLGGSIVKKRIATKGRGKSSSVRVIVAFKNGGNCFFLYGFEKNEKDNITANEGRAFKIVAKELLSFSTARLVKKIKNQSLEEVCHE